MTSSTPSCRARIPIARDGWIFILPLVAIALILLILSIAKIAFLCLIVALAVALFFRDPARSVPTDPGLFLSPADGKVLTIQEVEVETAPGRFERLRRVQIFLSILNVPYPARPGRGGCHLGKI